MQSTALDPTWALLTLLVTAIVGTCIGLLLIVLVGSRRVSKRAKRVGSIVGLLCFLLWLFTLGDPYSSISIEALYYRSVNLLPDNGVGRFLKGAKHASTNANQSTNQAPASTNGPAKKP